MNKGIQNRVLVVDDEPQVRELLASLLRSVNCEVETVDGGAEACRLLASNSFDLVFTDLRMPHGDGIEVLEFIRQMSLRTLGIIVTGHGSLDSAVTALRAGAFDYITKPLHVDELKDILEKASQFAPLPLSSPPADFFAPLTGKKGGRKLVGRSPNMRALNELISTVAASASTVLIRGESGTGKELVAHALHDKSLRRKALFVPVNCGAIPEDLLESELFGHVKGAFTGAISDRPGRFLLADGGTIFLDEIGDMSPKLQVKVLRVLQEHELEPVGSAETIQVDVRVLAATNVDLERAVAEKRFREDLYYRLNVIPIEVPPLREHPEDLPRLIRHFIKIFNKRQPRQIDGFSPEAIELLKKFHWPGNVRELENLVERMTILTKGNIVTNEDLPHKFRSAVLMPHAPPASVPPWPSSSTATAPYAPEAGLASREPGYVPALPSLGGPAPPPSIAPEAAKTEAAADPFSPPFPREIFSGRSFSEGVSLEERRSILSPLSGDSTPSGGLLQDSGAVLTAPPTEPAAAAAASQRNAPPTLPDEGVDLNVLVDQYERTLILGALEKCGGVKSRAAKILGIKRTTLVEKMKKKNIVFNRK